MSAPQRRPAEASRETVDSRPTHRRDWIGPAAVASILTSLIALMLKVLSDPLDWGVGGVIAPVALSVVSVLLMVFGVGIPFFLDDWRRSRRRLARSIEPPAPAGAPYLAKTSRRETPESTVAARIDAANGSLANAAELIDELQAEMRARAAALERLRAENAEYEKLAAVRKDEAEAISRLVEGVIASTHARLGRVNRRDQLLFFLLGLAASIPVQVIVTWLA